MSRVSASLLSVPNAFRKSAPALRVGSLALLLGSLFAWSWGKWPDVHIDFGNELYIAWRLSEGDVLYRDISHRNGLLSHYVNALWFQLFGVSIRTLVLCNFAILAGTTAITYRLARRAFGAGTAWLACAFFVTVLAFSQYVAIGNFNYITPYMHQQTHGLALALLALLAVLRGVETEARGPLIAAGLCLGLTFLTKAEIFAAALIAVGAGLFGRLRERHDGRLVDVSVFVAACSAPPFLAWLSLSQAMPPEIALDGVLGNWGHLDAGGREGGILGDPFYRHLAGLDAVGANLGAALIALISLGGVAALALAADRIVPRRWALLAAPALGICTAVFLFFSLAITPWSNLGRALPGVCAVGMAIGFSGALGPATAPERRHRDQALLLLSLFGLGLLGKVLLMARLWHYGFVLAMPASLVLVGLLVDRLPDRWTRSGGGRVARAIGTGAVCAAALFHWIWSDMFYEQKNFEVGRGADRILATLQRGRPIDAALRDLGKRLPEDATLAVLPDGAALNYWVRRPTSTSQLVFTPTELEAFGGEATVLAALRRSPPDFVALVHRPSKEFGTGAFGVDPRNGRSLMEWVRKDYRRVARFGAEPFGQRPGVVILARRSGKAATAPGSAAR